MIGGTDGPTGIANSALEFRRLWWRDAVGRKIITLPVHSVQPLGTCELEKRHSTTAISENQRGVPLRPFGSGPGAEITENKLRTYEYLCAHWSVERLKIGTAQLPGENVSCTFSRL